MGACVCVVEYRLRHNTAGVTGMKGECGLPLLMY